VGGGATGLRDARLERHGIERRLVLGQGRRQHVGQRAPGVAAAQERRGAADHDQTAAGAHVAGQRRKMLEQLVFDGVDVLQDHGIERRQMLGK